MEGPAEGRKFEKAAGACEGVAKWHFEIVEGESSSNPNSTQFVRDVDGHRERVISSLCNDLSRASSCGTGITLAGLSGDRDAWPALMVSFTHRQNSVRPEKKNTHYVRRDVVSWEPQ